MKYVARLLVFLVVLAGLWSGLRLLPPPPAAEDAGAPSLAAGVAPHRAALAAARFAPVRLGHGKRERAEADAAGPPRVSGAMRALEHWAGQRAYPSPVLPARGYAAAFARVGRELREPAGKALVPGRPWRALGPRNVGGRMLALAFNPQNPRTIWAGSASGGLWRSYTAGVGPDAWERVPTGHPVLGVGAVAFAPGDSSVIYIGTGEVYGYQSSDGGLTERLTRGSYGIGILKSEDGGATWAKSLDWSYNQERGVQALRIDPLRPEVVWAGTSEGTYRSPDAGLTWQRVHDVIMTTDIAIDPQHPDTVFVACGNLSSTGNGLYRTLDGGQSWTKMTQLYVIPTYYRGKALLSICESQPNVVMASIGNGGLAGYATWLVRSENHGDTWTLASDQDYSLWQGWFSHDVAIHPEDPSVVVAVGVDVWKSTAGGAGLQQKSDWAAWYFGLVLPGEPEGPPHYSHGDHHDLVYHPTDRDTIYLANDGGVFRSLDGGETFAGCNGGLQTTQFYAGFSSSWHDSSWAMGGLQDNSTVLYAGGEAWYRMIGGDGGWTAIDPNDDTVLYGSVQYLRIFRSPNSGNDWYEVSPPNQGTTGFIAPYALAGTQAPRTIYAGRSRIYRSDDAGVTWQYLNGNRDLDGNPALAMEVSRTDPQRVYLTTAPVTTHAGVWRTTDGGATWDDVTGDLPDRYLPGLCIHPYDPDTVYLTASGFGSSHVFRSGDGGETWDDIGAGLPDVPTSAVTVDPMAADHVYVGNDLGVFVSRDAGNSWEGYDLGLPEAVIVTDLTVSLTNHTLRASTHGNGVYERPLISALTGVPGDAPAAAPFVLAGNHPNPFNPLTRIEYGLAREAAVELAVFDVTGRRLRTLVRRRQPAGEHGATWDGRDARGADLPSGVYLYRLAVGDRSESRKMLLLR